MLRTCHHLPSVWNFGKGSKYEKILSRWIHKESNRTVGPPFRVVGSPYLSYHILPHLSRLSKKIRHRVLTDQTLCRICFPPGKRSTQLFYYITLWWICQSLFENRILKIKTLYQIYKLNPRFSTFHHAKDQNTVLKFSEKYSIIFMLFEHRTVFSSRIPWPLRDLNEKFYT